MAEDVIGFFVTGDRCGRCGDVNYDDRTRICLTCTYPNDPSSRAYREGFTAAPSVVIDGELVDAPRVLDSAPARRMDIGCGTHAPWLDCGLRWPTCTQHAVPVEEPDARTWAERLTTYRIIDHRRT